MNNKVGLGIAIGMAIMIMYNINCGNEVTEKEPSYPTEDETDLPEEINSYQRYKDFKASSSGDTMEINHLVYRIYEDNNGVKWIKPAGRESDMNKDPQMVRLWEEQQKVKQKQSEQLDEGDVREIIDQER